MKSKCWGIRCNEFEEDNKRLRAALDECAQWMSTREKIIPGLERLTDRARRVLCETQK